MNDNTKLTNAQLLSTSYNNLQTPKIALMGDRSPVTGLYESEFGGKVLTRKISSSSSTPTQPALVRGEARSVATADIKNASASIGVGGSVEFKPAGNGELNKDLWSRDVLGEPVGNQYAMFWFGHIEDALGRIEITPAAYGSVYLDLVNGNKFPLSNVSASASSSNKAITITALPQGALEVRLSYTGISVEVAGRLEVWAKNPGLIKCSREQLDFNRTGFGTGVVGGEGQSINLVRGNPADRSGVGIPNGNFYRLPFDIGLPGLRVDLASTQKNFLRSIVRQISVPIAPDIVIPP